MTTTTGGTKTVTALDGSTVEFDEAAHTYHLKHGQPGTWAGDTYASIPLRSVGEVVNGFTREFDAEAKAFEMAERKAGPHNHTQVFAEKAAILAEWARKRDEAAERGHLLHDYIDHRLSGESTYALPPLTPDVLPLCREWDKWWAGAYKNLKCVAKEQVLVDKAWRLAGTADAIFDSAKTGLLHVFDWKQNKAYATTSLYGDKLLPPFGDLDDCEHRRHSLQLSLYRLMLERSGSRATGDSYVLHLRPDVPAEAHRCLDLRGRLKAWLEEVK